MQQGARFIRYGYLMLAEASRRWTNRGLGKYSPKNKWERRIVTDVFLLHARHLLDFLAPRQAAKPDDVIAQHFAPDLGVFSTPPPRGPDNRRLAKSNRQAPIACDVQAHGHD
jgi:hypothetical protein